MPELAKRAGLSLAAPYNLFGSKAAVLAQVFDRLVRGFHRDSDWMAGLPASARTLPKSSRLAPGYREGTTRRWPMTHCPPSWRNFASARRLPLWH